ncbi:hypothetical protein Ddc_16792 [Ditylenchus destructor]|nr:hypothetical protein Ddc_16792 [Ditylenchus destructor]
MHSNNRCAADSAIVPCLWGDWAAGSAQGMEKRACRTDPSCSWRLCVCCIGFSMDALAETALARCRPLGSFA